jgi:hypothetical protein
MWVFLQTRTPQLLFLLVALLGVRCSDDANRQETVTKLRAIGVQSNPAILTPSSAESPEIATVTVVSLLPKEQTLTFDLYSDQPQVRSSIPLENIIIDTSSLQYIDAGVLNVVTFEASFNIPTADLFDSQLVPQDVLRLSYGFDLQANSSPEKIIGNLLFTKPDQPEALWEQPTINIKQPAADETFAKSAEIALLAEVIDQNDEAIKIGWFVSSGVVQERRGRETVWTGADPGVQTVVVAVYGRKSRTFAYATTKITVSP